MNEICKHQNSPRYCKECHPTPNKEKLEKGAKDFDERFTGVMKELAEEKYADELRKIESAVWTRPSSVSDAKELWAKTKPIILSLLASQKAEHCSEPDCPECNLAAYNKGREDMKAEFLNQPGNTHDQEVRRQVKAEIMEKLKGMIITPCMKESPASYQNVAIRKAITSLTEKGDE